jgi:hypothetical protein
MKGSMPPKQCPEGYDSVYLEDSNQMEKGIYQHKYAIYDPTKVQLLYSVTCKVSIDTVMQAQENKVCEVCDVEQSVLYCLNDNVYFCKTCDENVHENS